MNSNPWNAPQGDWKYLWTSYGLQGLLQMHRQFGWFSDLSDEQAADQLVRWSLEAGYDPVSGHYVRWDEDHSNFSLADGDPVELEGTMADHELFALEYLSADAIHG
jgi:hypothetical protein